MNIKQAKQEIKNTVKIYLKKDESGEYAIPEIRQRPILLMGPPGVGKTEIMEQIADECEIGLVAYTITHHTRQTAVGLPLIREEEFDGNTYSVTEYTMSEIIASMYHEMERTGKKEGILFIDEINCVSETLAPTMLQFLQKKTFGNMHIPRGWIIVAAGNPPEYNKSVREFDIVTLDRVRRIDVVPDFEAWEEYALDVGVHRAIIGYLKVHPKNFYRMETDTDGRHFVTARGWEDLSYLIYSYREAGLEITEPVIYEYIAHADTAEDFAVYLSLYFKYEEDYPVERVLAGDVPSTIYERLLSAGFDERVTVVQLILSALVNKIHNYNNSLNDNQDNADLDKSDKTSDELRKNIIASLDNAFGFIEDAFPQGEEIVLFVTELTMTTECVLFLAENPSEKYLKYSEELMVGSRRNQLLSEIKEY